MNLQMRHGRICFTIILTGKNKLVVLLWLSSQCLVTVSVLWLVAMGWSAVCDCGVYRSNLLVFFILFSV